MLLIRKRAATDAILRAASITPTFKWTNIALSGKLAARVIQTWSDVPRISCFSSCEKTFPSFFQRQVSFRLPFDPSAKLIRRVEGALRIKRRRNEIPHTATFISKFEEANTTKRRLRKERKNNKSPILKYLVCVSLLYFWLPSSSSVSLYSTHKRRERTFVCKWNIKPVPQRPDVLLVRSWSTRSCRATTTTSTCRRTATYGGRTRNSPHELSHIKKYVHVESNWLLLSNYIDHMKYTNREFDYFSLARFRWSSFQFAVQLWFASI